MRCRACRLWAWWWVGALLLWPGLARAANEGQEDLDKATRQKLTAGTMKDLEEVIQLCESARKKGLDADNDAFARQILSATLMQRGMVVSRALLDSGAVPPAWRVLRDQALKDLRRAVELEPQQAEAFLAIARLQLLPDGDAQEVRQALDKAIAVPDAEPDVRAKALVLRSELQTDLKARQADLDEAVKAAPREVTAILSRGVFLAEHGDPEKALADLRKAAELEPDRSAAYEAQAIVLARLKKYDEALVAIDRARDREPDSPYPLIQRSKIHALQGNFDAALHDLNQAEKISPDNTEVAMLRAHVYQQKGDKPQAQATIDKLLKQKPTLSSAIHFRAALLAGDGKYAEALAELEKLRRSNPKDVGTLLELAMVYSTARDYGKAVEVYSGVLEDKPKNFNAIRGRAYAYLSLGKHAEAIADFEKAYSQDKDDSELLNNFAWVLATSPFDKLRNGRRAIELATSACKLTDYKSSHILSTLAAAYAETGDFAKAREFSQKSIDAAPPEQRADLGKELESYKQNKPWRELHAEDRQGQLEKGAGEKAKPAEKPAAEKKPSESEKE